MLLAVFLWADPAISRLAYDIGDTVGDFTYPDVHGLPHSLYDFQGDIIVLNFFTTWCHWCTEEAPSLKRDIWEAYSDFGVTVIGLNERETADLVDEWCDSMNLTYPVLLMPNYILPYSFPNHGGIPQNVVLDRDMVLRYSEMGYDLPAIEDQLHAIIGYDPFAPQLETWGGIKVLFR